MMRVFFLVNSLDEFDFKDLIEEYLPDIKIEIDTELSVDVEKYNLVVLWSIRKILPQVVHHSNIVVFHSSALPRGRGWAPIYHTVADGEDHYTVTGIKPAAGADEGDIVVRARFPMRPEYTANFLRKTDDIVSLMLVAKLLERFPDGHLRGVPQKGVATHYSRRNPGQNEVSLEMPLRDIANHLRACEPSHPAFFSYEGVKYTISVAPETEAAFPKDLVIEFPTDAT